VTRPQRVEPGPGQESVWDYPRPPRVESTESHVVVALGGETVADSRRALRVLETAGPPVFYVPTDDVAAGVLEPAPHTTWCEFKGRASYCTAVAGGRRVENAAWTYQDPKPGFESLTGYVAFYPGRVDACFVDGEQVRPQPGEFYGGWITSKVVGPFKGDPGTTGW